MTGTTGSRGHPPAFGGRIRPRRAVAAGLGALVASLAGSAVALGVAAGSPPGAPGEGPGSAGPVAKQRADIPCPFGAVENLGPGVNTPFFEGSPTVSADERTMFFTSERTDGRQDLFVSTRRQVRDAWGDAVSLPLPVNHSEAHDYALRLSHDGMALYFSSERPGGFGSSDLWVTRRESAEAPWGPPENLGGGVNAASSVTMAPFPSVEGARLYFMSNRPGGFGGPDCGFWDCFDLYVATRTCGEEEKEGG
jgi:hypothetical protein